MHQNATCRQFLSSHHEFHVKHLNFQYFANFPTLSWLSCRSGTFHWVNSDSPVEVQVSAVCLRHLASAGHAVVLVHAAWGLFFYLFFRPTPRRYWRTPLDSWRSIGFQTWPTSPTNGPPKAPKVLVARIRFALRQDAAIDCPVWFYCTGTSTIDVQTFVPTPTHRTHKAIK